MIMKLRNHLQMTQQRTNRRTNRINYECSINLPECISYNCNDPNENPLCDDLRNWGCRTCSDGTFKISNKYPCIECNLIEGCLECNNFSGCVSCDWLNGYSKYYDTQCGLNLCRN